MKYTSKVYKSIVEILRREKILVSFVCFEENWLNIFKQNKTKNNVLRGPIHHLRKWQLKTSSKKQEANSQSTNQGI